MHNCIFCKLIQGTIPSHTLYEDDDFLVILDAFPASQGQALVIPKKHSSYVFDLEDKYYTSLLLLTKKIARAIDASLHPLRTCVVIEGFMVDHVHVRLHPCYEKHLALQPMDPRPTEAEFSATAKLVKKAI